MKNSLIIGVFFCLISIGNLAGQSNYIRNHSFENPIGSQFPDDVDQLEKCHFWKRLQCPDCPDGYLTSEWFKNVPYHFYGGVQCNLNGELHFNGNANNWATTVPAFDGNCYVGTIVGTNVGGEAFQQKMTEKLDMGYYELRFHYLLPCSSSNYTFNVFLSNTINDSDYTAVSGTVPTQNIGVWQEFKQTIYVPHHNIYDWFLVRFSGEFIPGQGPDELPYMYWDDFHLEKSLCTNCIPHDLISYNEKVPNWFTPDYDLVMNTQEDWWTVRNINNASSYELFVYNRWGVLVYNHSGSNPNGYFNQSVFWNGKTNNGNNAPLDEYEAVMKLHNCNTDLTEHFSITLCAAGNCVNAPPAYNPVNNYVPPAYSDPLPPFAHANIWVYGGPYNGFHHWRACERIYIGDPENKITPFYYEGLGAFTQFSAGEEIIIGNGAYISANTHFEINPAIQCCPQYRLQPELTPEADTVLALNVEQSTVEDLLFEQDLEIKVFPNPFENTLTVEIPFGENNLEYDLFLRDIFGRTMIETHGLHSGSNEVVLTELLEGTYFYELKTSFEVLKKGVVVKVE